MNSLELRLQKLNPGLYSDFQTSMNDVELLLSKFSENFPTYTDHSIKHTKEVFTLAANLMSNEEIENLNEDEIYVLAMACLLHDIGMCIPKDKLLKISKQRFDNMVGEEINADYIRNIHHELSYDFILEEYKVLNIKDIKYAKAIALVAMGHRKVPLDDHDRYPTKCFVKNGREFVCLPYLASVVRFADELDITNIRTPRLLTKYYMPNNEESIREWNKHISTTQINFTEDKVLFEVNCSDQNNLAALEEQFEKIQNQANYCQKIIRTISNTANRRFSLEIHRIQTDYKFIGFDAKGIQFTFDVQNVVKTFIGEDLYKNDLAAIREGLQNSIDSCRYKKGIYGDDYKPEIQINIELDKIEICDNGLGMDEFIIENFFGKLGSSFYVQEKVKKDYESIGQFGVGVFSYFLLAEYIDIETKTENGKSLKFRIDKDPKNYFHFFNDSERCESGTSIVLHKKKEIKEKYGFIEIENYIKQNFRYVEIPIVISNSENRITLEKKPFKLDVKKEIEQFLKVQHVAKANKFQLITFAINNEVCEGECGLFIKNFRQNYKLEIENKYDILDFNSFANRTGGRSSNIGISQKGVFVKDLSSNYLEFVIGNINLKRGHKISISRNEFVKDTSISKIIEDFELGLILELFKQIKGRFDNQVVVRLTEQFFSTYFKPYSSYHLDYSKLKDSIGDLFPLRIINSEQKEDVTTINELLKHHSQILLISNLENTKSISLQFDIPIVVGSGYEYNGSYTTLKTLFESVIRNVPFILVRNNLAYLGYKIGDYEAYGSSNNKISRLLGYFNYTLVNFDADLISVNTVKNKVKLREYSYSHGSSNFFNINHPFIKFLFQNYDRLNLETRNKKLLRSCFELLNIMTSQQMSKKKLSELNGILSLIEGYETVYVFSEKDFQE